MLCSMFFISALVLLRVRVRGARCSGCGDVLFPQRWVAQQGTVQGTEPYYVRMGVAWLLAAALAKFPDATRAFVCSSNCCLVLRKST